MIHKIKTKYRRHVLVKKFNNKFYGSFTAARNVELLNSVFLEGARVAGRASVRSSSVGKYSSIGRNSKVTHSDIGSFCAISWDTTINAVSHPVDGLTISAFPYVPRVGNFVKEPEQRIARVKIGNDVWVGTHVVIMPGIRIGNGAIIGAGSIVTKDVPDYAIVAGVPAKIIKYRFNKNFIDKLLKLNWWDLEDDMIKENIGIFQGKLTEEKLTFLEKLCI